MTIVYYSTPWFMDCDLPLVKAMIEQGNTVYYIMVVSPSSANATLLNNCKLFEDYSIHHAVEYDCLNIFKNYINIDNFFIVNIPKEGLRSFKAIVNLWCLHRKVLSFIRSFNPDVYHVSGIQRTFEYLKAYALKKSLVTTMHDPIPHDLSSVSKVKYKTAKMFFRLPKKIILLNNQQTKAFCQRYQIDKERIAYSRLGVYECTKLFASLENSRKFSYVLFFGRIQQYKGVELLIRAMRIVHEYCPELKLVIAGKGNINETWDESYIEVNNRFIESNELANMLRFCEFTICPYLSATQSGVVTTAFSMEIPVIATNVGGMKESVKDGETGLLVEPNNEKKLAEAIILLHKNQEMRNSFIDNIKRENSEGIFSWKRIASIYSNIYKQL